MADQHELSDLFPSAVDVVMGRIPAEFTTAVERTR